MASFDSFDDFLSAVAKGHRKGVVLSASSLNAEMVTRIHQKGKASDSRPIGTYTKAYANRRKKLGRQVARVDLDLTSVTRTSMRFRLTSKGFQIGYFGQGKEAGSGVTAAEKMAFAESNKRFGKRPISAPTKKEIDHLVTSYLEGFKGIF